MSLRLLFAFFVAAIFAVIGAIALRIAGAGLSRNYSVLRSEARRRDLPMPRARGRHRGLHVFLTSLERRRAPCEVGSGSEDQRDCQWGVGEPRMTAILAHITSLAARAPAQLGESGQAALSPGHGEAPS